MSYVLVTTPPLLQVISEAKESEDLARSVPDNGGRCRRTVNDSLSVFLH